MAPPSFGWGSCCWRSRNHLGFLWPASWLSLLKGLSLPTAALQLWEPCHRICVIPTGLWPCSCTPVSNSPCLFPLFPVSTCRLQKCTLVHRLSSKGLWDFFFPYMHVSEVTPLKPCFVDLVFHSCHITPLTPSVSHFLLCWFLSSNLSVVVWKRRQSFLLLATERNFHVLQKGISLFY